LFSLNLTTHIMFGILVGALLFGRPEIALMVGVGSAIPDLDREYGFFSKEAFRLRQIHRALFHNFLFIGIVYLINPFIGLGAFLHSFLDSFTTTRDRGVEWLFPFTRMVTKAVYDSDGNKLPVDPQHKHRIYFLSNDLPGLTHRTTKDIKPGEVPVPNRRTYGPALSGKFLDRCIFFGSIALFLLISLFSVLGLRQFINFNVNSATFSLTIPFLIGSVGVFLNFLVGELDRKKLVKTKTDRPYKFSFFLSFGIIVFAIILGGFMNPLALNTTLSALPYVAVGVVVFVLVAVGVLIYSTRGFSLDSKKEPLIV
jgi:hypothetical protein